MQISDPLGKKSRPTRASSTLDLPLLWLPSCAKMSCSLFTIGITECPSGDADDGEGADAGSSAMDGLDRWWMWNPRVFEF